MKVFISTDMEGVTGIVSEEETSINHPEYQKALAYLQSDIKSAVEGCREAGATAIVLNDSHDTMRNILLSDIGADTVLIRGMGKEGYMIQGLDQTCGAALFIGYHARAGSRKASLCHTFSWAVHHVKIGDRYIGEFGLNAYMAGYYKVPVVFVSGDRAAVNEAREWVPNVEHVVVKEAISRHSAVCVPASVTSELIKKKVRDALENRDRVPLLIPPQKPLLEVQFKSVLSTEKVQQMKGVTVIDGYTVTYEADDFFDLYLGLQDLITMSWSARVR